ncbi:MAG: hypothetical protein L3J67_13750 [Hyphomicrobiaceae bacterium]|nr:hypothetical protein [Hyphomicrobiaceae bacterium]
MQTDTISPTATLTMKQKVEGLSAAKRIPVRLFGVFNFLLASIFMLKSILESDGANVGYMIMTVLITIAILILIGLLMGYAVNKIHAGKNLSGFMIMALPAIIIAIAFISSGMGLWSLATLNNMN